MLAEWQGKERQQMIIFENVSKMYDPNIVGLDDVNVNIERGEFCFLVGHSGSGKSTFIRLLLREFPKRAVEDPIDRLPIAGPRREA